MSINLSMLLFKTTLILGTIITISTPSWIIMWIGLEMNLMSFIPLMNKSKTPYESEASMKYFIVQAMASLVLLMAILISDLMECPSNFQYMTMMTALFIKMGAAPFHLWFPEVMNGLTWINCFILMTWQKIAPMILMSYQVYNNMIFTVVIILSVLFGSIGGLNQTSIRKMMAYSSISHLGWLIAAMSMNINYWVTYFIIYVWLNIAIIILLKWGNLFQISQIFTFKMSTLTKFTLFISFLSLGGLPPLMGFLPKWIIIQFMISNNNFLTMIIMVMTTLLTLYFYLRMMYSAFTFNNQNNIWHNESINSMIFITSTVISLIGIPMITIINLY
uniref:NADH-ubiquinone oxidoreductase chain 2 n=1 Tax=Mesopodagrion tibetanum TaxID=1407349 RepID=A0A6C0R238_9ODON|nr:NADH dehydrogenase subunit 2 [Mesopodagrion tibetanum]